MRTLIKLVFTAFFRHYRPVAKKKAKNSKKILTKKKHYRRFAVIDIGSNAIRMMLAGQDLDGLHILQKFRFPIRLGADVFETGRISGKNLKISARTFKKFKDLCTDSQIEDIRAVGTSALRESKNRKAFVDLVYRKSEIKIEIIDGVEEARLIHQAVKREIALEGKNALLIDVGGGSVELTFSENGLMSSTQSFPFGTVRTLNLLKKKKLVESDLHKVMTDYSSSLSHFIKAHGLTACDFAIGTGGNLESLGKLKSQLLRTPIKTWISIEELQVLIQMIGSYSQEQRIKVLELRPDRADVILPAAHIVLAALKQASVQKILIPHVGLKEGLLWSLAQTSFEA